MGTNKVGVLCQRPYSILVMEMTVLHLGTALHRHIISQRSKPQLRTTLFVLGNTLPTPPPLPPIPTRPPLAQRHPSRPSQHHVRMIIRSTVRHSEYCSSLARVKHI
jgi:hypothetical protein